MPNFSFIGIILLPLRGHKNRQNRNFDHVFKFGDQDNVPTPLRWGPNLAWGNRLLVYCTMPNFTMVGIYCHPTGPKAKNAKFCNYMYRGFLYLPLNRSGL